MSANPNGPGGPPAAGAPGPSPTPAASAPQGQQAQAPAELPPSVTSRESWTREDFYDLRPSERAAIREADPQWVAGLLSRGKAVTPPRNPPPPPPAPASASQATPEATPPSQATRDAERRAAAIRGATVEALLGKPGVTKEAASAVASVIASDKNVQVGKGGALVGFDDAFKKTVDSGLFNLEFRPAAPPAPMPALAKPSSGDAYSPTDAAIAAVNSRTEFLNMKPTDRAEMRRRFPDRVKDLLSRR